MNKNRFYNADEALDFILEGGYESGLSDLDNSN